MQHIASADGYRFPGWVGGDMHVAAFARRDEAAPLSPVRQDDQCQVRRRARLERRADFQGADCRAGNGLRFCRGPWREVSARRVSEKKEVGRCVRGAREGGKHLHAGETLAFETPAHVGALDADAVRDGGLAQAGFFQRLGHAPCQRFPKNF